jgi:hypothetical protein
MYYQLIVQGKHKNRLRRVLHDTKHGITRRHAAAARRSPRQLTTSELQHMHTRSVSWTTVVWSELAQGSHSGGLESSPTHFDCSRQARA